MDIHEYINDIMIHIFNDKELIEKLKEHHLKKSNLILEVKLASDDESDKDTIHINMYKKSNKNQYLKDSLPKYKKIIENDLEQCCICLEDYKENTYKRTLNCSHHFHKKCIDKWLKKCDEENIHCPICRTTYEIPLEFISNFSIKKIM